MAQTITEKNVIQITVQDTDNNKQSFNMENPKSELTIAQVREIFEPLISTGKWYSRQGNPINYIEQATLTKTKKITLDDGTEAITVTPASGKFGQTFTVTGSPIKGYNFTDVNLTSVRLNEVIINNELNTIQATLISISQNPSSGKATLNIITAAGTISVNLTVN